MERYRNIRLEMPDAEAAALLGARRRRARDTEDLAAWLRDVGGEGISDDPFDSSIDASWLGAAPTGDGEEDSPFGGGAFGNGVLGRPPEPEAGPLEAGA